MKTSDIYSKKEQLVSFEIFPPRGDISNEAAYQVASELAELSLDFINVTYSAGSAHHSVS